jgi:membrane protein YdbS with pleckstrin-like domain
MSNNANLPAGDSGHGDSVAAWTAVIVIMVAFATGTLAFWFDQPTFVWASVALAVVGLVLGFILKRAGYGVNGSKSKH